MAVSSVRRLCELGTRSKEWGARPEAERRAIGDLYYAFAARLREEGRLKGGSALSAQGRHLTPGGGGPRVSDGPYCETKEALTGYFLIQARDLDEAVEVAKDCPALTHGDSVEVIALSRD